MAVTVTCQKAKITFCHGIDTRAKYRFRIGLMWDVFGTESLWQQYLTATALKSSGDGFIESTINQTAGQINLHIKCSN
jgi:hypothetical protein